jgi:hypothetical protein
MATNIDKVVLSGSTGGMPIKVVATATTGTTIHTTGTSASIIDEVWLYATNTSAATVTLTIEYGSTTAPDQNIIVGIPSKSGLSICVAGLILAGTGSVGRTITAFAGTASVINIAGYINRIS